MQLPGMQAMVCKYFSQVQSFNFQLVNIDLTLRIWQQVKHLLACLVWWAVIRTNILCGLGFIGFTTFQTQPSQTSHPPPLLYEKIGEKKNLLSFWWIAIKECILNQSQLATVQTLHSFLSHHELLQKKFSSFVSQFFQMLSYILFQSFTW